MSEPHPTMTGIPEVARITGLRPVCIRELAENGFLEHQIVGKTIVFLAEEIDNKLGILFKDDGSGGPESSVEGAPA